MGKKQRKRQKCTFGFGGREIQTVTRVEQSAQPISPLLCLLHLQYLQAFLGLWTHPSIFKASIFILFFALSFLTLPLCVSKVPECPSSQYLCELVEQCPSSQFSVPLKSESLNQEIVISRINQLKMREYCTHRTLHMFLHFMRIQEQHPFFESLL